MSLGKDLASIRKGQNLSLEDIQNAVKIPLDTLKSIENDSIFDDKNKNKTYVRSFVRSYAKELKLNDDEVVQALDEVEAGTYAGSILRDSSQTTEDITPPSEEEIQEPEEEQKESPSEKSFTPEPVQTKPKPIIPPQEDDAFEWADLGNKFSTASKSSRLWTIVVAIVVVLSLAGASYYFWDDIFSGAEDEPVAIEQQESPDVSNENESNETVVPPAAVDSSTAIQNPVPENNPTSEPAIYSSQISELGDTLTVAVYAAYGQLEPVRITSDLNWTTNPFWMEEGEAYNFDFRDTLLVRGQYSRLLLLFNGHVIENPRQNYFDTAFNSIMITRDVIEQPEYLEAAPLEFPLEVGAPDSIIYRIRF